MGQVERITVEVPEEVAEALREVVASGAFASVEEAARDALEGWGFERATLGIPDDELRALVEEGLSSGEPEDGEAFFARLRAELEAEIDAMPRGA